jgi:glycosyltransferase involved in cell wall biosynthesis
MSQAQLREQYQNAFCFIMPSVIARNGDRDGIPNVVFEAMAMGKPVVATSISGIPEAVDDKRTGLIVPPRDPERLADAINLLLQRPTWAHVLGDHACMWVQVQFSAKEHMARLVQQMQSLLRSSDRRKGPPDRRRSTRAMRGGRRQSDQIQAVPVERAPLRIMYVIWSLEVGGAERVVVQQALGIDRTRFEPMVVCLNHQGRLAHSVREAGVEVVALEKSPGVDLSLPFKLAQLIRMHKIDIVHAHLWGAALWARLAIVLARRGIVIVQEHGMQAWRGRPHFWVDRLLHPLTRRILFVSHDVRKQYLKRSRVPPVKCQLIPNGVVTEHVFESKAQIRERFAWESSELIILSVGRLAAEKGHIDLVDAFAKIASRVPHARLILVGDGPERVRLEASMRQHHLQGRIVFAGIQDDVPYWMKAADIYVQPSHREALSLAILEAMSMGLTVVATRVGEVENVITDGVHGYLVPPHDPQALADKLLEVCSHIEEGLPVSAAAQQVIRERYSLQRMLDVVQAIYDEEVPLHRSL